MTRAHRRTHFIVWIFLAPAITALLIAALVARARVRPLLIQPQPTQVRP